MKLLLTSEQAQEALGVCAKTLYSLTYPRGPIPVVRIGGRGIRYSVAALERWIEEQEQQGTETPLTPKAAPCKKSGLGDGVTTHVSYQIAASAASKNPAAGAADL